MPIQEKFWIVAVTASCVYASHLLLALQVDIDVSRAHSFVLLHGAAVKALIIVAGTSFLSGAYRFTIWKETLFGIAVGIAWYLFWDSHTEYRYQGYFAFAIFTSYASKGPGAFITLLNLCVAPVFIAGFFGLMLYQALEWRFRNRRKRWW